MAPIFRKNVITSIQRGQSTPVSPALFFDKFYPKGKTAYYTAKVYASFAVPYAIYPSYFAQDFIFGVDGLGKPLFEGTPLTSSTIGRMEATVVGGINNNRFAWGVVNTCLQLTVSEPLVGVFGVGDALLSDNGDVGVVLEYNAYQSFTYTNITGTGFVAGDTIIGGTSGTTGVILSYDGTTMYVMITSNPVGVGFVVETITDTTTGTGTFDTVAAFAPIFYLIVGSTITDWSGATTVTDTTSGVTVSNIINTDVAVDWEVTIEETNITP